jgi:hypothetical protein
MIRLTGISSPKYSSPWRYGELNTAAAVAIFVKPAYPQSESYKDAAGRLKEDGNADRQSELLDCPYFASAARNSSFRSSFFSIHTANRLLLAPGKKDPSVLQLVFYLFL